MPPLGVASYTVVVKKQEAAKTLKPGGGGGGGWLGGWLKGGFSFDFRLNPELHYPYATLTTHLLAPPYVHFLTNRLGHFYTCVFGSLSLRVCEFGRSFVQHRCIRLNFWSKTGQCKWVQCKSRQCKSIGEGGRWPKFCLDQISVILEYIFGRRGRCGLNFV